VNKHYHVCAGYVTNISNNAA